MATMRDQKWIHHLFSQLYHHLYQDAEIRVYLNKWMIRENTHDADDGDGWDADGVVKCSREY
jgi:hypothetical protein